MDLRKQFKDFIEKEHRSDRVLSNVEIGVLGRFIEFVAEEENPPTLKIHVSDKVGTGDTVR